MFLNIFKVSRFFKVLVDGHNLVPLFFVDGHNSVPLFFVDGHNSVPLFRGRV